ncbi:MAG TPA: beta-phosphoglucomutase, partial [Phycisphaerae bacterium]|nr:beta-phosphoglucomutase [Phycisphaerae bacterium]
AAWVIGPNQGGVVGGGGGRIPAKSKRAGVQAVLFDLDGVLVDTARFHHLAWKRLADELGVAFNEKISDGFRGVGRMECLEKLLGKFSKGLAAEEKRVLADRKNGYYLEQVMTLRPGDLAAGARHLAMMLRAAPPGGVRMGLVSASKNARLVLELLGITDWFDAIVDGTDAVRSKPDPQGFLLCAKKLRVEAEQCVVVEDAEAGIRAGQAAGMVCVGIGASAVGADCVVKSVGELTVERIDSIWANSE